MTQPKVALITGVTGQDADFVKMQARTPLTSVVRLAYVYLPTPRGASAKVRLAHDFLARKEHEFERLQHEIVTLRSELKEKQADA